MQLLNSLLIVCCVSLPASTFSSQLAAFRASQHGTSTLLLFFLVAAFRGSHQLLTLCTFPQDVALQTPCELSFKRCLSSTISFSTFTSPKMNSQLTCRHAPAHPRRSYGDVKLALPRRLRRRHPPHGHHLSRSCRFRRHERP